jgi:hypothetical protein
VATVRLFSTVRHVNFPTCTGPVFHPFNFRNSHCTTARFETIGFFPIPREFQGNSGKRLDKTTDWGGELTDMFHQGAKAAALQNEAPPR